MINFLLASVLATAAPRTSPPVRSTSPVNSVPASKPSPTVAPTLPAVPIVYPNRNVPLSPSPTTQPSTSSWSDKVWERYQDRQRSLPLN
jgi:hypothetical protein